MARRWGEGRRVYRSEREEKNILPTEDTVRRRKNTNKPTGGLVRRAYMYTPFESKIERERCRKGEGNKRRE